MSTKKENQTVTVFIRLVGSPLQTSFFPDVHTASKYLSSFLKLYGSQFSFLWIMKGKV